MSRILKLEPFYSEKVWGYEEWTLSTHRNGHSKIKSSDTALINHIKEELPILNKIIKANDTLSVQVHPDDEFSKKYENDTIKCIPKQEIYHFEQSYQYVILCCEDDYYNLLMNYRIHRDMLDVQVYSLIGKQKYEELYQENIELLQTIEDIERLIKHLYDQKKNKC